MAAEWPSDFCVATAGALRASGTTFPLRLLRGAGPVADAAMAGRVSPSSQTPACQSQGADPAASCASLQGRLVPRKPGQRRMRASMS
jgi:hypothetical protein